MRRSFLAIRLTGRKMRRAMSFMVVMTMTHDGVYVEFRFQIHRGSSVVRRAKGRWVACRSCDEAKSFEIGDSGLVRLAGQGGIDRSSFGLKMCFMSGEPRSAESGPNGCQKMPWKRVNQDSRAKRTPRALCSVSSNSAMGSESATMPAPTW